MQLSRFKVMERETKDMIVARAMLSRLWTQLREFGSITPH